jgi:protein-tyrosine phosphatase
VVRVLFVCLGNICRSPMAEGVFRRMAAETGLAVKADSAGLGGWHMGDAPDRRAQAAALARGADISRLRARQVTAEDYRAFDLMLAMDRSNLTTLRARTPPGARARTTMLLDYAPEAGADEVRDPYYDNSFDAALDLIEAASAGLIAALRRG